MNEKTNGETKKNLSNSLANLRDRRERLNMIAELSKKVLGKIEFSIKKEDKPNELPNKKATETTLIDQFDSVARDLNSSMSIIETNLNKIAEYIG